MYRILVVDDEKIGRKGVHFLLDQLAYELEIIEAKNGKEALEILKNTPIDILLTDIKMPFIDGLELIKEAVKIYPSLKIAIFSGYSDFDYAKQALTLGVLEYILKPVSPEEFNQTIKRLIEEVDKYKENEKKKQKHEDLLHEHLLYNLVMGKKVNETVNQYKRLILISFSQNFFDKHENIKEDILKLSHLSIDYLNLNFTESLLFIKEDDKDKIYLFMKEIVLMIDRHYHKKPYLALSKCINQIDEYRSETLRLEDLVESMYYQPDKHIYEDDSEELVESDFSDIEKICENIKKHIQMQDMHLIKEDFIQFNHLYINQKRMTHDYIKFVFSSILKDIYASLTKTSEKELDQMIVRFYRANDYKTIKKIMEEVLQLLDKEFKQNESLIHNEVKEVVKYVYNHYNLDLSVDLLANEVHLAPSYLSHIFKKETGENLGKFIKKVRMEKAKDMLETTNERIVSISVAVGYENVSYFCQSFREYYGISPQKYRKNGEIL